MLDDIKFLYDIYKGVNGKSKKKELLRTIIRAEAKLNNDIAGIISRNNATEVAKNAPKLFTQLETSSFDLLSALGMPPHEAFDEKKDPSYEELENIDKALENIDKESEAPNKGANTYAYFDSRSQSELYEFYIRKSKLLIKLSRSKAISKVNIGLNTRIQNIEHATRILNKRLK